MLAQVDHPVTGWETLQQMKIPISSVGMSVSRHWFSFKFYSWAWWSLNNKRKTTENPLSRLHLRPKKKKTITTFEIVFFFGLCSFLKTFEYFIHRWASLRYFYYEFDILLHTSRCGQAGWLDRLDDCWIVLLAWGPWPVENLYLVKWLIEF